ncbi:5-amino-6-(5-phospho-D-ribitylamino)uracil phosphatase YigB [Vibrio aestuarianus]|uniref:5-amino-6-(5-phospho-D-ribitylamino)uracil phosphatase n=1 Tax=Vibrio aestuarianus TaxID=28171 RepID=A0ABN8TZ55_9VIBR|nr:5-amino-6-(5-phospho-D-ribitylamino)uracil phosphatase YigB [Vibrio aestuarianus]MDE1214003.1 5-amino-6-(5-phospho-D-ribitylamino)uracil phosphatase YigB [Vibrio aestuarianus]MDE1218154.1 5-amino-6-(5-phospho-D-ribitylamino)uracil phosphatase YigB [Vibrio aestuarianus]MDE1226684.1 5-amino-6-(5-phospho-D-ribitylamino)uracil phosphatase YigB [Vibrio aestuarianus]MDE1257883.1 5-amino-6-(5-phospho-D-ribitylamino)uracil phosphatase YigB [Vibrio aestuarianus]MDE1262039.1 5-amino-6-(5-phospho-D-ri
MHFYRSTGPIKAMSFDLDDTLYDNRPVIRHVEQQMVLWLHRHHPLSATRSLAWWQQLKLRLAQQQPLLRHDVTQWRFKQIEQGLIELGYSSEQALEAANAAIEEVLRLRNLVTVPQETHRVMTELAKRMPLVAITNGNVDPHRIGLGDYFELILKAGPDGLAKPHPELFDKARIHLALPANSILHVGDHLVTDVQGAKCNGFQACWYNDQGNTLLANRKAKILPDIEINQLSSLLLL